MNLINQIEFIRSQRNTETAYTKMTKNRNTQPLNGLETKISENLEKLTHPIVSHLLKQTDASTVLN